MDRIDTISELLSASGSQFRIYDIGRKITKISKDDFNKVEHNQLPYPYPIQGHACFSVVFWQAKQKTPYLWFIKLPLDERGLLNQGARNHFIAIIIEALGKDLTVDPSEQQQELLNSNPYHITPAEYKMAAINSIVKNELKQAPSIHFEHFQEYIAGNGDWDNWQTIGIQGISDVASQVSNPTIAKDIAKHLNKFPEPVFLPLCQALENQTLSVSLIDAFIALTPELIKAEATQAQLAALPPSEQTAQHTKLAHIVRALASSAEHPHVQAFISELIASEPSDDVLITIAGRCWQALTPSTLEAMLSALAAKSDLALFNAIFKDLVAIPALRPHVFSVMRSETRSDALAKAIGQLFN
ncbi:DUF3549 family protein [Colwellia sp. MEBiC06753]